MSIDPVALARQLGPDMSVPVGCPDCGWDDDGRLHLRVERGADVELLDGDGLVLECPDCENYLAPDLVAQRAAAIAHG